MFEHLQINIGLLLFLDRFDNIPTIVNRTMLLSLTYIHDLIKNNGPRKAGYNKVGSQRIKFLKNFG